MASFWRFLELLAASVLVGGLVAAGAIGQVTFGSPDILSHEQAGRLMARVFEGSLYVEGAAVALIGVASIALRRTRWLFPVAVLLVGGHLVLAQQMRAIRELHGGSVSKLERDHPDRKAFGARHGIYNVLALGLLGTGIAVLAGSAREARGARGTDAGA